MTFPALKLSFLLTVVPAFFFLSLFLFLILKPVINIPGAFSLSSEKLTWIFVFPAVFVSK